MSLFYRWNASTGTLGGYTGDFAIQVIVNPRTLPVTPVPSESASLAMVDFLFSKPREKHNQVALHSIWEFDRSPWPEWQSYLVPALREMVEVVREMLLLVEVAAAAEAEEQEEEEEE